jgi:hypothetical protein
MLPGRRFCKPSCKARHEWQQAQRAPNLFNGLELTSELPAEDDEQPTGGR